MSATMGPSKVRRILADRRAWLAASVEQHPERHYHRAEIAALDWVFQLLAPFTTPRDESEREKRQLEAVRRIERVREQTEKKQQQCTCEQCPVHRKAAE